ncbi:type I polyketide synthase [Actinoplanes sp. N902-109]|uniref:type I polyketide synthase n=1 Tax=Actinoplanes sp. (strain N902-109) TaxID=649831 RepID=UPI00032964BC|nr:type I polyketide synthase [Actinoplanes sp. N902-109]AGL19227.1 putative polyketide synthase [Actinoplanes sp. N902-109]
MPENDLVKALRESVKETARLRQRNSELIAAASEPIAIVSMGCRFAGGITGPEEFWSVVSQGTDVYTPFPDDRGWDLENLYDPDPDKPGTTYVKQGAFLRDAAQFDARFFGISPQEALAMDPQQRQLLEVCWETVERAGIDPRSLRGSDTGVFAGVVHQDYAPDLAGAEHYLSLERALGSAGGVASGRIAYCLGLEGPAVTVDTMCSSSLVAIHLASQALRRGECAMALAGGATVMATPGGFVGFARQRGLAFDGRCKSFAAGADGSSWAEGAGVLLLERLSDARRNGHQVLAVIRGSAVNQDGASNGLTAPNGPAQQRVIRRALQAAGLNPGDIDAVEAHGTGTSLGDPIEAQALFATYGQDRDPGRPLLLGSVKSIIGHTQAASGVAGIIKTVLALRHGHLPATRYVDAPTPRVDWSSGTVELLLEGRDWPAGERLRRSGVSSFGASGTNVHLILEEAPAATDAEAGQHPHGVLPFVLSAQSPTALAEQARRLAAVVDDIPFGRFATTLATGRARLSRRAVVVARDPGELRTGLELLAAGRTGGGAVAGTGPASDPGQVVFVFPGQGTQWAGMGRDLLDSSPVFAARIAECQEAFDPWLDWSIADVLRGDGPGLARVDVVQPACFAVMLGLAAVWTAAGVTPDAVIGHSQGEIAAACVAGALTLADAARVVILRSQAIADKLPRGGGMASVELAADEVAALIAPWGPRLEIAALNGPAAVVVAGEAAALDELAAQVAGRDFRFKRIAVDYASHSHYVEAIEPVLRNDLAGLSPAAPGIPFYSTTEVRWLTDADRLDAGYWYRNLRGTVRFEPAVRDLIAQDHRVFIELGAHPTLLAAITATADAQAADVTATGSIRRDDGGPDRLLRSMAELFVRGVPIAWETLTPARTPEPAALPTYPFDHQRYWITMPGTRTSPEALGQKSSDHPLLGAVVDLPQTDGLVLTSRLSLTTHPWLAGHRIQDVVLVPGTVYVDLAVRAGDELGCGTLDELVIEAPLPLPPSGSVRIQVAVGGTDATGRRPIEVYSSGEHTTGWTRHATGLLSATPPTGGTFDFTAWPPAGARREDIDGFYPALVARGYDYGPAFAGLTAVWRRGDEIFAEAALPAGYGEDAGRFGIHPALLDAALHANAFHRRDDERNVLPFAWNGLQLHATGARSLRVRVAPYGPDALSFEAADEHGAPVLSMESLVSLPVADLTAGPAPDSLWQLDWAPVSAAPTAEPGRWAQVTSTGDVARIALAGELGDEVPEAAVLDLTGGGPDTEPLPLLHRVLAVVQAWLSEPVPDEVPLVVVTRGAAGPTGPVTDPPAAAVWGLVRAAQAENPGRFVLTDIEPGADRDRAVALALAAGEPQSAVRADTVHVPRLAPARLAERETPAPALADGTVLITGGTGVLGRLLARHLVERHGVRHLVLASRRGPAAEGVAELVEELGGRGAAVRVVPCDLTDRAALTALLDSIPAEHPLTGLVHAAGVLDDSTIEGLDPRRLDAVFQPKAGVLRTLDELTRARPPAVFAAFSSAASVLGSAGQGNYAAANACTDALMTARRAAGLPAVSLAWGLWEPETAMTGTLTEVDRTRMSRAGVRPLPTGDALRIFDAAIGAGNDVLIPIRLDLGALRAAAAAAGSVPPMYRGLVRPPRRAVRAAAPGSGGDLGRRLAGLSRPERTESLLGLIREEVATVLGLGQPDPTLDTHRFGDIGFDSLTGVELRNRLSAVTAVKLPATLVFDYPTPQALAQYLLERLGDDLSPEPEPAPAAVTVTGDDPVVVVGMACRLPGGIAGPDDLWRMVAEGRDGMSEFPQDRGWDLGALFDPDPDHAGTSYARRGGFLHDAAEFDAALFGISPREALAMDPQQRLLLESTWEALESAGIDPLSLRGERVGVYTGMSIHDYLGSLTDVPAELEGYTTTATAGSVASGRVSYAFGLEGPAMTVDTACSSSLVAIHLAAQALLGGECRMALAGGVAVMGSPVGVMGFSRARGLAADGRCKPFSADADGTVLSEGVGVVLLERLSDARREGHRVLAVVRGSAINQDGASNGLTAPNGPAQQRVIRAALAAAGVAAADIDVLEAHGTGTTLGDPIEAQAIVATYGAGRSPENPLRLGSVKSNLGHTQAAAGVVSVIKMVQAMRHETLPPTLYAAEATPHVDWSDGTVALLTDSCPWPAGQRPRRAGVSSFGISGTNAHLILEQAPPATPEAATPEAAEPPAGVLPFVLSANSPAALAGQARRLHAAVAAGAAPAATARTLFEARALLGHRAVVAASGTDGLLAGLDALGAGETAPGVAAGEVIPAAAASVVFVFPGQGSQRPGMGRELYDAFPGYATAFDDVCAHLDAHLTGAVPLRDAVFAEPGSPGAALLDETAYTQAALFATEVALFRLTESWGVRPALLVGHSIGEISAAYVAGMLSLDDAALVVATRGRLMQNLPTGGAMAAVAATEDEVRPLLGAGADLAAVNHPGSVVLSGTAEAVEAAAGRLRAEGRKVTALRVSHAFHSALMDPMLDDFRAALAGVTWQPARIPVVHLQDGDPAGADYWVEHVRRTVRFADGTRTALDRGGRLFVEMGPGTGLSAAMAHTGAGAEAAAVCTPTLRDSSDEVRDVIAAMGELFVRGVPVDLSALLPAGGPRADLPTYAFDHKHYWLRTAGSRASAAGLGLTPVDHPLLSAVAPLPDAGGLIGTARLTATSCRWLPDGGTLPPAAFVELALRAGDEAGCAALDTLTIDAPLVLGPADAVRLEVVVGAPDETGRRVLTIHSAPDGFGTWVRHATAVLSTAAPGAPEPDRRPWPPAAAGPADPGADHPQLVAVWRHGDEMLAEAALDDTDAEGFQLDPRLLDAVTAGIGFAGRWDAVALHATGAGVLRARLTPSGDGTWTLRAADATGAPVLTATLHTTAPAVAAGAAPDAMFEVRWQEITRPEPAPSSVPCTPITGPAGIPATDAVFAPEPGDDCLAGVLAVLQAWLRDAPAEARLVVLTREAVPAGATTVTDPDIGAAWGLVRAAQAENPGRIVLLDAETGADTEAVVARALTLGEPQIAVRANAVLVPRLAPAGRLDHRPAPLDPTGTVLVTGGTGSLGALVARHLAATRGVRHLLLVSRSGLAAPGAEALVADLSALGATVTVAACDVADRAAVAALLAGIPDEHPLTAVVHTAGILDDGLLEAMTPERLTAVLAPKATAARHLHELTRAAGPVAFVAFSSAAGLLGSAGQANYAAANAYLDTLMAARHAAGLPGVSLSWGLWEQDGGITGHLGAVDRARMNRGGVLALEPAEALALFDAALDSDRAHLVPMKLDLAAARADAAAGGPVQPLLGSLVRVRRRASAPAAGTDLAGSLAGRTPAEQESVLLALVRSRVALIMGYRSAEEIGPDLPFQSAGLDSLTAVELRNRLGAGTGITLPTTVVFDYPTPRELARHLRDLLTGGDRQLAAAPVLPAGPRDDIAVVGVGCRLPGGVDGPDDFWDLLANGRHAQSPFPADRGWDLGRIPVRAGGFLPDAGGFDAGFFGISPREAVAMDPQQRILLEVVWEALENAGIDPFALRGTDVGVFVGVMGQGYGMFGGDAESDGLRGTGGAVSVVSGRVSYVYGFTGPAVSVDTACSSSLVAMHLARQALRDGECSLAVVGGVTVMTTPGSFVEFAQNGGLATDGRCKAFAASADGTGNAEGVAVVLLERLADARTNGHTVRALVRGSAVSQDGASNGLTAPNGPAQQRVIRRALAVAGLAPAEVDAVEAHGTGTRLGDPIEAQALLATYGDRDSADPLWLGSVKSNVGHTQATAGVTSVIKMVLALEHEQLPATLHVDTPTPEVDWSAGTVRLLTESRPWPVRPDHPRRAGVSAFGLSGTNVHLILEEPPAVAEAPGEPHDEILPFVLSARDETRLAELAARLAGTVERSEIPLRDLAAALAHGRSHHRVRSTVLAAGPGELVASLAGLAAGSPGDNVVSGTARPGTDVVFVFPGQGAQWIGMGSELLATSPDFRAWVRRCDDILAGYGIDWTVERAIGDDGDLSRVEVVQPATFVMMTGLAQLWAAAGVVPDVVLGSSQGEIAAACVAGLLSLEDALHIVVLRSRLAAGLPAGGGTLVLGAGRERAGELIAGCGGRVEIGAVNGPSAVVLTGERGGIDAIAALAAEQGIWHRRLAADYASHSFLVEELREPMLRALDGVGERPAQGLVPRCRFMSTVDVRWIGEDERLDAEYWFRNLRRPVLLDPAIRMAAADARAIVEISTHPGLATSLLDVVADTGQPTAVLGTLRRGEGGRKRLLTAMAAAFAAGLAVDWTSVVPVDGSWRRLCGMLPTYPFDHRHYWLKDQLTSGRSRDSGHPLVVAAAGLGDGALVVARLDQAWIAAADPSAVLVELAIRAGDEVDCPVLEHLELIAPLPAEPGAELHVRVGAEDPAGRRPLVVASVPGSVIAEGLVGPSTGGREQETGTQPYAEVSLPPAEQDAAEHYGLHPLLLSAAAGLRATRWEGVTLHASGAAALRVRVTPVDGGVALDAVDEAGLPVLTVDRIVAAATEPAATDEDLTLRWSGLPLEPAATPLSVAVLDDPAGLPELGGAGAAVFDVPAGKPAEACAAVLGLAQMWLDEPDLEGHRLIVRTHRAVAVEPADTVEPAAAAVWDLVATVQAAYPGRFLLVDTDTDTDTDIGTGAAGLAVLAGTHAEQVALRGGRALRPRLVPIGAGPAAARPDGTVLVTGDPAVALGLAESDDRREVVLAWPGAGEDAPALPGVTVTACDVNDPAAVRHLLDTLGPLTAVVLAMPAGEPVPFEELDADRLTAEVDARVAALEPWVEPAAGLPLSTVVVVTSTAALTGPADRVATAAADGAARALAARHPAGRVVALPPGSTAGAAVLAAGAPFRVPGRPDAWAAVEPGHPVPFLLRGLVRPRRRRAAAAAQAGPDRAGWAHQLAEATGEQREQIVLGLIRDQLVEVLRLDPGRPLDTRSGFFELGLDSLMAMDLSRRLSDRTGIALTPSGIFSHPTLSGLTKHVLETLDAAA